MKTNKQDISGVLLLDKPLGLSSNTALQKVKRIYNALKAGHTGTLDPLATGLLPICFGEATKFSSFLLDADKEYVATIKLGVVTTTYDAEGEITSTQKVTCSQLEISSCIQSFLGEITQYPPIYSALKVNGKALYDYARNGEEVEIKSRNVFIHELEIIKFIDQDSFTLRVLCSKGTYIRSLAHDIGQKLGCGAHLIALNRTKTNNFSLSQAISIDDLLTSSPEKLNTQLLPTDILVQHIDKFEITDEQYRWVKNGNICKFDKTIPTTIQFRLYFKNRFLGLAENQENVFIKPIRLCNTANL